MAFLDGYRVLDLTDERGLLAGRLLADLGADVVIVEPPGGSTARRCEPMPAEGTVSYVWQTFAANRRGVVADLETQAGRDRVLRLARQADFMIESADPGQMARLGLDWGDLHHVNPGLIYVSITAFGRTGPKALLPQSDLILWAAGGPLEPHRDGDRPPVRISIPQAFLQAASDAAAGALLAHHARVRTGRGQLVDVSAQAALGLATLGRVLAAAARDDAPDWEKPVVRVDQSGSGSATPPSQKKWPCRDGIIEFHIGIGPAAGLFTSSFFNWVADESHVDNDILEVDWKTLPSRLEDGSFTAADMERARRTAADFLATKTKDEVLAAAVGRKLLCVPIYDTTDVNRSVQLRERKFFASVGGADRRRRMPARFVTSGVDALAVRRPAPLLGEHTDEVLADWGKTSPSLRVTGAGVAGAAGALAGLMVLDFSWVVAGPVIGRALADFGATVIRVETSRRPETVRHMPPFQDGKPGLERSNLYHNVNAGKLGIDLDLSTERGREIARELAAVSDVVIESFSVGQMEKWGLDYERLSAARDDLIMLSTTINGQTGPIARQAGYGNIGAALSGFQEIVGWPDRPALGPFGPYTDYLGPRMSLVALLGALEERRRTGRGCHLDISQVEAGAFFQSPELCANDEEGLVVQRRGNADRQFAPNGVYRCADDEGGDRWIALTVPSDDHWRRLTVVLGREDLLADDALSHVSGRFVHSPVIDEAIGAWTRTRSVSDVETAVQAVGVPCHRAARSRDFCEDPQLHHRNHLVTVPHPQLGSVVVEGPRYLLSETPGVPTSAGPVYGQDTRRVLKEFLNYSDERVDRTIAEGACS